MTPCYGADNEFGPRVATACRPFDFTLLFEDALLAVLPAAVLLLVLPWRLWSLARQPTKMATLRLSAYKLTLLAALALCHLLFLVLRLQSPRLHTRLAVAAGVLNVVAAVAVGLGSFLEDQRSLKPSTIIVLYLSASALLATPQLRSLWLIPASDVPSSAPKALWTAVFVITVAALVAESLSKSRFLRPPHRNATTVEQTIGLWERALFVWILPLFRHGYAALLDPDDLPAIDGELSGKTTWTRFHNAWTRASGKRRLIRTTTVASSAHLLSGIIPRLVVGTLSLCQPFLVQASVAYMSSPTGHADNAVYGPALVGAFVLVYVGIAISRALYRHYTNRFVTSVRGGLITKVYRHTTTLTASDLKDAAAMTLMGTDVEQIGQSLSIVHELWASVLEVGVAVWLLAQQVTYASILPLVICVASVAAASAVGAHFGPAQRRWIECIQERMAVTTSMLMDIKSVKMLGLDDVLHDAVSRLRKTELQASERFRALLVWQILISNAPEQLAPFATFVAYAIIAALKHNANSLSLSQAFTSLSLVSLLTASLLTFCQALPKCLQATACFGRIDAFLSLTRTPESPRQDKTSKGPAGSTYFQSSSSPSSVPLGPLPPVSPDIVSFRGAFIGWSHNASEHVLSDINLSVPPGFTAVVGQVAAGKSTLLASIVGETIVYPGTVAMPALARIAYCPQTPWMMNDTIRRNVTGGLAFDQDWYNFSLSSSCLRNDVASMPQGDMTTVGSNGSALSGGQRQRLSLARAVYSRHPLVILDDITSGLDPVTCSAIMTQLFSREGHFRTAGISVIFATNNPRLLSYADKVVVLGKGRIADSGTYEEIRLRLPDSIRSVEATASSNTASSPDEQERLEEAHSGDDANAIADSEDLAQGEERSWIQGSNWEVYGYYYRCAGALSVCLWALFTIVAATSAGIAPIWLEKWMDANEKEPQQRMGLYIGVYALIFVLSTAFMAAECWTFFVKIINDTAMKLHDDLLTATLRAPYDFFLKTNAGTIMNRFNQDMDLIDMTLPSHAIQFTTGAAACLVQLIIICIMGKYLAVTIPVLVVMLFFIQRYYLRTSRQIRLYDIEAKAPLYSLFVETVQGAPTIRAFGWEAVFYQQNERILDQSQRPFYMLLCIQQWLTLVLDLVVALLAILLITVATSLRSSLGAGSLGVALVLVLSFNSALEQTIESWTKMETSIGAVARVRQFLHSTPSEQTSEMVPPPADWPAHGAIAFEHVTASYVPDAPPALDNVSLRIEPGEKIAICGPSGSGKTSLVMALLRMMSMPSGRVLVDHADIAALDGRAVRALVNVFPQEPFLTPGTIRSNLAPHGTATDESIEEAVRKVDLWETVAANGGLDAGMVASKWSPGERQLLSLARVVLDQNKKILVLDEATSSVDDKTEAVMQAVLDAEFQTHTILAVLHRFTFIDRFDKVAVLDHGKLVEYDAPQRLLARDSAFRKLYEAR